MYVKLCNESSLRLNAVCWERPDYWTMSVSPSNGSGGRGECWAKLWPGESGEVLQRYG